ncbi:hypothetical protein DNTS_013708 [Danionella cerebrum]|uniref:PDZ domain-containing protein n=1 Tax=Danionella cerebrum TaxID=2873325 RepID=A0A553P150_9TELE|nr:hypothetical protein DNTS_013708 [Danionella translucida]
MSHREEPEESGLRGPPPHRSKPPNGTPLEGGRPRWRPCQLHNPDAGSQGHHHHPHQHYHHHQANLHPHGSSRAPPRNRRRHVPGQAQRRRSETGDSGAKTGQQPKLGTPKQHRTEERVLQHKNKQQHKEETPKEEHASDPLSPEDSSQDLLTPSPQDEPVIHEPLDEDSPDVQPESSVDQLNEKVQIKDVSITDKEFMNLNKDDNNSTETFEPDYVLPKPTSKSRPESKRTSPLRVDVPPFATSPPHLINKPFFQPPRMFPETVQRHNSHPKSFPTQLNTSYASTNKEIWLDCSMSQVDHYDYLSNSAYEASTESSRNSHDKSENHIEMLYYPTMEEPPEDEGNHSMSMDECDDQEELETNRSVGSRLHHYDEQSEDEADCIGRSTAQVRNSTDSTFPSQNVLQQEASENTQFSPDFAKVVEMPEKLPTPTPDQLVESFRESGDAVSLAIKDIKEAIEEVKTKTVRSPYTPDEIKEPVWVMRQDMSPVEESHPQFQTHVLPFPQSPSQLSLTSRMASHQDAEIPLGAESAEILQNQDQRISPNVPSEEPRRNLASFPTYVEVPGPCDPEDLIDGIIFAANYLGSTQLLSERTPTKSARMQQAQEAMSRVRTAQAQAKIRHKQGSESGPPTSTEVDLFISTQRIKVLSAFAQDTMMDHPLRTISYIADIGNMVVLMARRKVVRSQSAQENLDAAEMQHTNPAQDDRRQYKMVCHVFESEDAQLIAQSIGQAFSVAYQEFLRANGIDPEDLSQREYSDLLNTQDMYNDDLIHFSKSENCRDVYIEKQKGEILGVVIVESGWGSILPTVIIASLMHGGPAAKSGRLNIGDQIMTVNGTSLVGLPLSTCQSIIKGLKAQSRIKLNIVRCPPVTMVLIRRPDLRYQLGFSVQNGIICSLMRGGIAERGGVRVGHRIIEINGQSVVATPHEKIVHILSNAVGEIHMKTMPAAMYRLLTAQEQPVYI